MLLVTQSFPMYGIPMGGQHRNPLVALRDWPWFFKKIYFFDERNAFVQGYIWSF